MLINNEELNLIFGSANITINENLNDYRRMTQNDVEYRSMMQQSKLNVI